MVKYEVCSYSTDIKKVEIERETDKSVFINGNRRAKMSEWSKYFHTFDEAKSNLVERCTLELERCRRKYHTAKDDFDKVLLLVEGSKNVAN